MFKFEKVSIRDKAGLLPFMSCYEPGFKHKHLIRLINQFITAGYDIAIMMI